LWIVIEDFASAMELVILPIALIGYLTILVVKFSETIHLILFPFTFIIPTIFVVKFSETMPHSVKFIAFVPTTLLILFVAILRDFTVGFAETRQRKCTRLVF
jgi:hypothetical protein